MAVLTPEQAKGLEFDSVIIVDPAGIEQASPRGRADLYVALTRTTRRLGLIRRGEMPRDLKAAMDQVQSDGSAHSASPPSGILAGPGM